MTIPRRSWRAAGTLAAAAVVGLSGAVLSAGPAAAHTPTWDVTCTEVSLHLTAYNDKVTNQVTVTVDGKDLLPTETFGRGLDKKIALPEHDKPLTVHLVVKAGDGDQYSKDDTKTAPVCEGTPTPTPTPSETKPSETPTTSTPTPTDTPSESASPSAPAAVTPSPSSPDLAETGSSSATPIIGGAAVAVLLAGGGIMWSVRKRRTAQH
ncbi:LAETG motif-containing sortase-dependent surface protein [Streptomyces sp. ITFR-16]|uniref:LAETG motif-containing sortase-dependent surface protein n=1 Tax=Streptomyces sp. ITFR-16 TaxID=3075198 RepID=UPI0028892DED|nr:LAETG motif-containing sortase-dependent surface protein [Streptomyces sp. ITFR-16]WNI20636.1 LAETG motif-containing sortase-dependent surface protein [Streptomyces sp. ITFR-16]